MTCVACVCAGVSVFFLLSLRFVEVDMLTLLITNCPQLKSYELALRRYGFDSPGALRFLSVADLAEMNMVPGH